MSTTTSLPASQPVSRRSPAATAERTPDEIATEVRALLLGLLHIHNFIGQALHRIAARQPIDGRFSDPLTRLHGDVELLLSLHGVERTPPSCELFDPCRQTVLRVVPTDDLALIGRIAESLRPGFTCGDALLQREWVTLWVAAPAPDRSEGR
jgi:molecular chaperone GrpE (heat shock protein)